MSFRPLLVSAAVAVSVSICAAQSGITAKHIAGGFASPLYVTHAPGDTDRVFVLEQYTGRVRIVDLGTGQVLPQPFVQVTPLGTIGEQGLLGMAFHPDYDENGYVYICHTDLGGTTVVARYTVDPNNPNRLDAASYQTVIRVPQPFANHNAGWIGFGPNDSYLYIATGDGGSNGDPGNRSQTIVNELNGKMLRIDVDGDDFPGNSVRNYAIPADNPFVGTVGDDEIWAYGLRNPWRCSFDPATGDLWMGDVGENVMEVVNFQPASSAGGENYGWRCYEGTVPFNPAGCPDADTITFPAHEYPRGGSPFRCAITGGKVYRGCAIPGIQGRYFFADFCSDEVLSILYEDGEIVDKRNHTVELNRGDGPVTTIVSFGYDAAGEMYIVSRDGAIYKVVPTSSPRECPEDPCGPADLAEPFGVLDVFDVIAYLDLFEQGDPAADLAEPFGVFDVFDVLEFLRVFEEGCP